MSRATKKKRADAGRNRRGQFKPGVSGNPGGRPRSLTEFRQAARELADEALSVLRTVMRSKSSPAARVRAVREVLDRAFGKPAQELHVAGSMLTVDASKNLTQADRVKVARRLIFLLSEAAHVAARAAKPEPAPVRRRVSRRELRESASRDEALGDE